MNRFEVFERILKVQGVSIDERTKLLDFGCGAGELVKVAHQKGIDAYGCDIDFSSEWINLGVLAALRNSGRVRQIEKKIVGKESPKAGEKYRLPFNDGMFDVVISDQVLEHVSNYAEVMDELSRVLRPGGVFLHIFPSRYRPIEPHIFVPFASCFSPHWWLSIWARLGVRNPYQKDLGAKAVAIRNEEFLATMTNYLTEREIVRFCSRGFRIQFVERDFMRLSQRAGLLMSAWLYRTFWSRCVFGVRL